MDNFNLGKYLKDNRIMENANPYLAETESEEEGKYTEFIDDGENQYLDFNYGAIESIMGDFGKTSDDLEDWLDGRNTDVEPTDEEVEKWLNNQEEVEESEVNLTKGSLKDTIKEMVLDEMSKLDSNLDEAASDDEEVEVEDDLEMDSVEAAPDGGGSDEIMNHLEAALEAAKADGQPEKVIDQIGNTITMMTRINVSAAE